MSPGISVVPGSAMRVAPAGTFTEAEGPAASIFVPRTSTTQPGCGASVVPSQTASGLRTVTFPLSALGLACAATKEREKGERRREKGRAARRRMGEVETPFKVLSLRGGPAGPDEAN